MAVLAAGGASRNEWFDILLRSRLWLFATKNSALYAAAVARGRRVTAEQIPAQRLPKQPTSVP
jgi:hypothetical protein